MIVTVAQFVVSACSAAADVKEFSAAGALLYFLAYRGSAVSQLEDPLFWASSTTFIRWSSRSREETSSASQLCFILLCSFDVSFLSAC